MPYYLEKDGGLEIRVRVQPKASRTQLDGVREDQLRIRLTAPPVDNAANQAVVEFVAKTLGVPKWRVELSTGHKSRDKTLFVCGSSSELAQSLRHAVEEAST